MSEIDKQLAQRRMKENDQARRCTHSKSLLIEPELQETKRFASRSFPSCPCR